MVSGVIERHTSRPVSTTASPASLQLSPLKPSPTQSTRSSKKPQRLHVLGLELEQHVPLKDVFDAHRLGRHDVTGAHMLDLRHAPHESQRILARAFAWPGNHHAADLPRAHLDHAVGKLEPVAVDIHAVALPLAQRLHPRLGREVVVVGLEGRSVPFDRIALRGLEHYRLDRCRVFHARHGPWRRSVVATCAGGAQRRSKHNQPNRTPAPNAAVH
jgi:hypothetical protein